MHRLPGGWIERVEDFLTKRHNTRWPHLNGGTWPYIHHFIGLLPVQAARKRVSHKGNLHRHTCTRPGALANRQVSVSRNAGSVTCPGGGG